MKKISDIHCRLQYLVDKLPYALDGATLSIFGKPDPELTIDAISLYTDDPIQVEPAYLYLCRPEHLKRLSDVYKEAVLLCVNHGTPLTEIPETYRIIVVSCRESLEFVFNELQKTITHLKTNNVMISRAILEQASLQEILNLAEKTIKNPIILLDAACNLLGYSGRKVCMEPFYTETIRAGMIPHSYIMKLMERDSLRRLYMQGTLVLPKGQFLENDSVILVMLKEKNMVVGYGCLICSETELRQPMIQGFEEIIYKFKNYLIVQSDTSCFQEKNEFFFYIMLLNDSITDAAEIGRYAKEFGIRVVQERVLHVLLCQDMPVSYAFTCMTNDVLDEQIAFVYGNSIVVIERADGGEGHLVHHPAYHSFLAEFGAVAGVSVPFYRIQDSKRAYQQGMQAVRMGRMLSACQEATYFDYNRRTYRYSDLMPYLMIEREYTDTHYFPITCMGLLTMLHQDLEKNTDFAHTLFVYLKNDGHVIETAQEMFFHRNSILHRMKQISDSLKLNLSDCMVRDELLFHFRVIDYARAIGKQAVLMEMIGEQQE